MCFKKWFKPSIKPPTWQHSDKVALLFGINDYPGTGNDLRGCLNDIELVQQKLPDFQIRKFKDFQVTKANFEAQINYAIANSQPGDIIYIHYSGHGTYVPDRNGDEPDGFDEALYLYDGVYIDDDMNHVLRATPEGVTVMLGLDSCFSGTATRAASSKGRFMPLEGMDIKEHVRIKHRFYDYMSWMVLSGCGENQTSADALIDGTYYGAFTYFAFNHLLGIPREWHTKIREYLPNRDFDQAPTIEGPDELLDKIVFVVNE